MRQIHFSHHGTCYAVAAPHEPPDGFERVPTYEAVALLRELERTGQRRLFHSLLENFNYRDPPPQFGSAWTEPLVAELWSSWLGHGGRIEIFRRPRPHLTISFDPMEEAVELSELAEAPLEEEEHWIEVEFLYADQQPVIALDIEIETPSGMVQPGRTSDFGLFRMDGLPTAGACKVRWAELDESDVPEPVVVRSHLSFEVVDDDGPCANMELSVELPDGTTQRVTTDSNGLVTLDDVAAGLCTISQVAGASA